MGFVMLHINEEAAMLAVILNQSRYSLSAKSCPLNLSGGELSLKIKGSRTQYKIFFFCLRSHITLQEAKERARRRKETDT